MTFFLNVNQNENSNPETFKTQHKPGEGQIKSTTSRTAGKLTSRWKSRWELERQSTDDRDEVASLLNPVHKHQVIHVRGPGAPTPFPTVYPAPKAKVRPPRRGPAWIARTSRARPPKPQQRGLQERTGAKSSERRPPRARTGASCLLA